MGQQIRVVAGFAEIVEREETLVAEACKHPNLRAIPFRAELIRCAALPTHRLGLSRRYGRLERQSKSATLLCIAQSRTTFKAPLMRALLEDILHDG